MNAHFEKKLHFENESVFFGKVKVINHFLNSSLIRLFANLLELILVSLCITAVVIPGGLPGHLFSIKDLNKITI